MSRPINILHTSESYNTFGDRVNLTLSLGCMFYQERGSQL